MKYDHREVNVLDDMELVQAYQNCLAAEKKREAAKATLAIRKIELPPISPIYLELKNEIHKEMTNRGLEVEP